jgi:hypothetical protein
VVLNDAKSLNEVKNDIDKKSNELGSWYTTYAYVLSNTLHDFLAHDSSKKSYRQKHCTQPHPHISAQQSAFHLQRYSRSNTHVLAGVPRLAICATSLLRRAVTELVVWIPAFR